MLVKYLSQKMTFTHVTPQEELKWDGKGFLGFVSLLPHHPKFCVFCFYTCRCAGVYIPFYFLVSLCFSIRLPSLSIFFYSYVIFVYGLSYVFFFFFEWLSVNFIANQMVRNNTLKWLFSLGCKRFRGLYISFRHNLLNNWQVHCQRKSPDFLYIHCVWSLENFGLS